MSDDSTPDSTAHDATAAGSGADDNEALVTGLWRRIWIDKDIDRIEEFVTDPYVRHTRDGTVSTSPAEYARHIESAVQSISITDIEINDVSSAGDRVYLRLRLRGMSLTTGDELTITWLAHYRCHEGRVAEAWTMHQTGLDW